MAFVTISDLAGQSITLKDQQLYLGKLKFNVVAVVDGRTVKSLGVIQNTVNNSIKRPVLKREAAIEVMDLITRSHANSGHPPDMVLRIENLKINEVVRTETVLDNAVAELTMDFFFKFEDQLYFIDRKHAMQRSKGVEVVDHHAVNITTTIAMVLQSINAYDLESHILDEPAITMDEVARFQPQIRSEVIPILEATQYPDGIYQSFTQFRNNQPAIGNGYYIEEGKKLSLHWTDKQYIRNNEKPAIYAIAHNDQLFFNFDNEFYPIEKRGNTLLFFGPETNNPHQVLRDWFWGGLVAAAAGSSGQDLRMVYEIDLYTGGVRELGYKK